jgi:RNA-directed DNA polymerase
MAIWHSLWRWATRRHPNKPGTWIVDRYWDCFGRKWYFAVLAGSHAQRSRSDVVRLADPTDIPILRYVKVKSDANPFDPHWRGYFESRKRFRKANRHR